MKKLLISLMSFVIIAPIAQTVVSCTITPKKIDKVEPKSQEQNFRFYLSMLDYVTEMKKSGNIRNANNAFQLKDVLNYLANGEDYSPENILNNNGLFKYNINPKTAEHSFNTDQNALINALNSTYNLGLKVSANVKEEADLTKVKTNQDLLNSLDVQIDNFDKLANLKVTGVEEIKYLKQDNKWVKHEGAGEFEKIIDNDFENIGDGLYLITAYFNDSKQLSERIIRLTNMNVYQNFWDNQLIPVAKQLDQEDIESKGGKYDSEVMGRYESFVRNYVKENLDVFDLVDQDNRLALTLDGNDIINGRIGDPHGIKNLFGIKMDDNNDQIKFHTLIKDAYDKYQLEQANIKEEEIIFNWVETNVGKIKNPDGEIDDNENIFLKEDWTNNIGILKSKIDALVNKNNDENIHYLIFDKKDDLNINLNQEIRESEFNNLKTKSKANSDDLSSFNSLKDIQDKEDLFIYTYKVEQKSVTSKQELTGAIKTLNNRANGYINSDGKASKTEVEEFINNLNTGLPEGIKTTLEVETNEDNKNVIKISYSIDQDKLNNFEEGINLDDIPDLTIDEKNPEIYTFTSDEFEYSPDEEQVPEENKKALNYLDNQNNFYTFTVEKNIKVNITELYQKFSFNDEDGFKKVIDELTSISNSLEGKSIKQDYFNKDLLKGIDYKDYTSFDNIYIKVDDLDKLIVKDDWRTYVVQGDVNQAVKKAIDNLTSPLMASDLKMDLIPEIYKQLDLQLAQKNNGKYDDKSKTTIKQIIKE